MTESNWQTVALPKTLLDLISEIIERGELGYSTKSEFVKEAVRDRILALKNAGLILNEGLLE